MDVHKTIKDLMERARKAQEIAEGFSQRKVDEIAAAIVYTLSREDLATEIAIDCVAETDMGEVEMKTKKLVNKMPAIFYQIKDQKTVGVIEENVELGLTKIAKPIGIIAALVPSTNPEATPVFKGVLGLRARNAVIFAPHPNSKKTTDCVVEIMRGILEKNGVPKDLFLCIDQPSKDLSQELMKQADLTMATGSGDMVKAAYSSGKPAYGVGAGNAAVVVDETAELQDAAKKIRIGKIGDHASGCSAENSLVINETVYDEMLNRLEEEGGYILSSDEKQKLQSVMWQNGQLSREIVAKPVKTLAKLANIEIPENIRFLIVKESSVGKEYPFSGEKMSLVLTVYKYKDFPEAIDLVKRITAYSGLGHSCGIHSNNEAHIMELALNTKTTRVIVRQPHGSANSGNWFNGLANTFSLGCGTWGGNIISENVSQKHYLNTTWVARPIDREPASEEEIFGNLLKGVIF